MYLFILNLNIHNISFFQSRKAAFRVLKVDNLCKSLFDGANSTIKCPFEKCKFIHDIEKYLTEKPTDISETCYIYSTKGFCARGVTCRFAHAHLDDKLNNRKNELVYDENAQKTTVNQISTGNYEQTQLKYSFTKNKEVFLFRTTNDFTQTIIQF